MTRTISLKLITLCVLSLRALAEAKLAGPTAMALLTNNEDSKVSTVPRVLHADKCPKEVRIDPCLNSGLCSSSSESSSSKSSDSKSDTDVFNDRALKSKTKREKSFQCECAPGWQGPTCEVKACDFGEYYDTTTEGCLLCNQCDSEGAKIANGGCGGSTTEDDRLCSCKIGYYNVFSDDGPWARCEKCYCDGNRAGTDSLGQYINRNSCLGNGTKGSVECEDCEGDEYCQAGQPPNDDQSICDGYGFTDTAECQCFPFNSKITLCKGDLPSEGTFEQEFNDLETGQKALCYKHDQDKYHDGPGIPDCCAIVAFTHLEKRTNSYVEVSYSSPNNSGPDQVLKLSSDHLMFKVHPDQVYNPQDGFSYTNTLDATADELDVGDSIVALDKSTNQTKSVLITRKTAVQEFGMIVATPDHAEAIVVDGVVVNAFKAQNIDDNGFPAPDWRHDFKRFQRAFKWMNYNATEDDGVTLALVTEPIIPTEGSQGDYLKAYRRQIRNVYVTGNATAEERSDYFCKLAHEMIYTDDMVPSPRDLANFYKQAMAYSPI